MLKTLKITALLGALVGLGACTEPVQVDGYKPVDATFTPFLFHWRGLPGDMKVFWKAAKSDTNTVMICGAYVKTGTVGREHYARMLRESGIAMNGTFIISDLQYFTSVARLDKMPGASAACQDTGVPYPAKEPEFGFGTAAPKVYKI